MIVPPAAGVPELMFIDPAPPISDGVKIPDGGILPDKNPAFNVPSTVTADGPVMLSVPAPNTSAELPFNTPAVPPALAVKVKPVRAFNVLEVVCPIVTLVPLKEIVLLLDVSVLLPLSVKVPPVVLIIKAFDDVIAANPIDTF